MSDETRKTGKLDEYDNIQQFGHIKYHEDEDMVYLSPEEAQGKGLKEGSKITFTIRKDGSKVHAVDVEVVDVEVK